ncbi:MAG: hypothetical protein IH851_00120 [Armatimonadetes bacterium]|nr:hypothetical protein [Armatimonadota bacterium]
MRALPQDAWAWRPKKRSELVSTYFPTIKEQAQHIASAERWYVQKLWPAPKFARAKTPLERIKTVREFVVGMLRERGVADGKRVVDVDGQK